MSLSLPKTCSMGGSKTGLVGTVGVTLLDPDGTTHTARATADIYEIGGGCYGKEITFEDNWKGVILWDTGGGSPVYASDEYDIEGLTDAGVIADAIWDELQSGHIDAGSFGKYLDQEISTIAAAIGSGLLSCTWTQRDGSGNPMDNVQIWITTDEAGSNVVAGALYTNTAGEATFMLDAGTYYVWREKGGFNFTNPQSWTVS
jgi:hypothetical protein